MQPLTYRKANLGNFSYHCVKDVKRLQIHPGNVAQWIGGIVHKTDRFQVRLYRK